MTTRLRWLGVSAVVTTLAATLSACTSSASPVTGTGPDISAAKADPAVVALLPKTVAAKGELVVGTEAQYPPFEFYQADNKTITGFDADIAASLATVLGLKLTLRDAAFDSIIPSLASGRYDLGMSGFTVTSERVKQVDFVTYYYEGDGLMVKAGNPKKLTIGNSLCGAKIAVSRAAPRRCVQFRSCRRGAGRRESRPSRPRWCRARTISGCLCRAGGRTRC